MGLGGRLSLAFATVVAITALVVGGAGYLTTDRQLNNEIDDFLRDRAAEVTDGQRDSRNGRNNGRGDKGPNDPDPFFDPDAEVQILDRDGNITENLGVALPVTAADELVAERSTAASFRTIRLDGKPYRMITAHVSDGGAVQVAARLAPNQSVLNALRSQLLTIVLGLGAMGAALGWWLANRITQPLRSLTAAVDTVAETQDFALGVHIEGTDEVGRLGRGFNRLLGELDMSQQQQRRLVQDAAHELRTPLTSIRANVSYLARPATKADPDEQREVLGSVERQLIELSSAIDEIIDLATDRYDTPEFVDVDFAIVVDEAVESLATRSNRPVRFEPTDTVVVHGDHGSLRRMITNIIGNADKYSPEGLPIEIDLAVDGTNGTLVISDHGPGIDPTEREAVFDRFYRSNEARSEPGSGLGLAIVKRIIDLHNGTIAIGEAATGGTAVRLSVPLATSVTAAN